MDDGADLQSRDGRLCEITMDGRTYPACSKHPKQHIVWKRSRHYLHSWRCDRHRGTTQACEPTRWSEKRRLEFDVDRTPCPACIGKTVQYESPTHGVMEVVRERSSRGGHRKRKRKRKRRRPRTPSPEPTRGCCVIQ